MQFDLPSSVVIVLNAGGRNEAVETTMSAVLAAGHLESPALCAASCIKFRAAFYLVHSALGLFERLFGSSVDAENLRPILRSVPTVSSSELWFFS